MLNIGSSKNVCAQISVTLCAPQVCVSEGNITLVWQCLQCITFYVTQHLLMSRLPSWHSGVKPLTTHPGMLPCHLLLVLLLLLPLLLLLLLLPHLQPAVRTRGPPLSSQVSIP